MTIELATSSPSGLFRDFGSLSHKMSWGDWVNQINTVVAFTNHSQIWQQTASFRKTKSNKYWCTTKVWQKWDLLHDCWFSQKVRREKLCNCTHIFLMFSGQHAFLYLQLQLIYFLSCHFFFLHCLAITCLYIRLQLMHLQQDSFMIWGRRNLLSMSLLNQMGFFFFNYFS